MIVLLGMNRHSPAAKWLFVLFVVIGSVLLPGFALAGEGGSGATLGSFKGKTVGLGPVISYVSKIGTHDALAELKWLHETETNNRLKGDIVWRKAAYKS